MPEPTPEQLGREAGEAIANAIADNLEAVLLKMADSIATLAAQQERLGNEVQGIAASHDNLTARYIAHLREHHRG